MIRRITPNLKRRAKIALEKVRVELDLADNIRFVIYDSSAPLDVLVEIVREDYPHPRKEGC